MVMEGLNRGSLVDEQGTTSWEFDAASVAGVATVGELADLLRQLRRRHARRQGDSTLTYRELAARTGWAHGAIGQYLSGQVLPPTHRFDVLVRLLGASAAELGVLATVRDRVEERRRGGGPLGAMPVVPRQLPADLIGFVGRTAQLSQLDEILTHDGRPVALISAVSGMAGVGKTSLAVHWAHRVADQFPGGQLYANLRGFDPAGRAMTADEAVRGFLHALGISGERMPSDLDAQVGLYRSLLADRRVLVVLDNVATVDQVRPLLPGTPTCMALVTSRNQLYGLVASHAAHPIQLDVFSTAEAEQMLVRRLGTAPVEANAAAVDELVAACARLPLALAVMAARVVMDPSAGLAGVVAGLRQVTAPLDAWQTVDAGTDVRTVFSWSYRQLTAPAARLFRQLGTHPGPSISDAAAASLAGLVAGEVRRLLADLVRAQLLTEPSPGRYAFHDLLRAYATELGSTLDSDVDRRAAEGRMLDHYLHTANTATLVLSPSQVPIAPAPPLPATTPERPGGRQEAMEWFGAEHAVLVTLVVRAADAGLDRHAWQLADTLTVFLDLGGHWHDRVTVLTAALAAAQRLGDPWAQARTHRNLAGVFVTPGRGEEARAEEHLRRALELFGQLGDRVGQGRTHHSLGVMLLSQGKHREAIEQGQHTLTLCRAAGDQVAQAHALNLMGFGHTGLGEHELALACCERALALFEESGDRFGTAATWDSLGYAQHQRGEYVEAGNAYRRAHALFRDLGARIPGADALDRLGDTHDAAGDAPAAAATWREALAIYDELGHPAAAQVRAKLHP